jgi:hypothetical protein
MQDLLALFVPWLVQTALVLWLLRMDEARWMNSAERSRSFPAATRIGATVMFGVLALIVHVARTRRTWRGALIGAASVMAVMGATGAAQWLVE